MTPRRMQPHLHYRLREMEHTKCIVVHGDICRGCSESVCCDNRRLLARAADQLRRAQPARTTCRFGSNVPVVGECFCWKPQCSEIHCQTSSAVLLRCVLFFVFRAYSFLQGKSSVLLARPMRKCCFIQQKVGRMSRILDPRRLDRESQGAARSECEPFLLGASPDGPWPAERAN